MSGADGAGTSNTVSGGTVQNLLQGRDFRDVTFNTVQAAAAPVALAQLPAPVAGFTGREAELAEVTGLLDPAAGAGAVVVSAVAGLAGVGKTALAIQAAHAARAAGWFPGGVLFLDLHGYDDQRSSPGRRWMRCCAPWVSLRSTSRRVRRSGPGCTGRRWPRSRSRCWWSRIMRRRRRRCGRCCRGRARTGCW